MGGRSTRDECVMRYEQHRAAYREHMVAIKRGIGVDVAKQALPSVTVELARRQQPSSDGDTAAKHRASQFGGIPGRS